jgi:hypothetical protein
MPRYELTGSGISGDGRFSLAILKTIVKEAGGKNIREAYHHGWRNQPKTVRFNASNDDEAEKIGRHVYNMHNGYEKIGPMYRAYGLHWSGYKGN